jgi:hypothetical protein
MKKTNAQILTRELKRRWVDHRIYNDLTGSFCLSQMVSHLKRNGLKILMVQAHRPDVFMTMSLYAEKNKPNVEDRG